MILKQNCFVISDREFQGLEEDTYIQPKSGYSGSSIQRKRNKHNDKISLNEILAEKLNPKKVKKLSQIEHKLSTRSKIKIREKITAWANTITAKQQVKFTFCTLTLTSKQIGEDKDFTKMQNVFFTYLRKYLNLKNYLYVLEKQENGNIHSHILFSQWMPVKTLNRVWCKILSDNGYTYDQNGTIVTPLQGLINKAKNSDLTTPSPVDISVVHNLKNVSVYVTKYITKNETTLNTSIWNCSQSISKLWTSVHISAKEYYLPLMRFMSAQYKITLDDGFNLNVYLLKIYTQLQKKLFNNVNEKIICY